MQKFQVSGGFCFVNLSLRTCVYFVLVSQARLWPARLTLCCLLDWKCHRAVRTQVTCWTIEVLVVYKMYCYPKCYLSGACILALILFKEYSLDLNFDIPVLNSLQWYPEICLRKLIGTTGEMVLSVWEVEWYTLKVIAATQRMWCFIAVCS